MATILAPASLLSPEEWPDADFDFPDGVPLDAPSDKDDNEDEDWDVEFKFGSTGSAKARPVAPGIDSRSDASTPTFNIIRPPIQGANNDTEEDDEEGVSTIKGLSTLKATTNQPSSPAKLQPPSTIEEDIEDAFDLPSDLTQLSLTQQPLSHRSSKNSLEWGDRDQTNSSQSSDAYSSLGLADADRAVSTSSASSASLSETDTEDEGEALLEGLVVPPAIFDSGVGVRKLTMMLELKKKAQYICDQVKIASPDPEDDFEAGLVFDDDADLSPSRLLSQQQSKRRFNRCNTVPLRKPPAQPPPLRVRSEHAKLPPRVPIVSTRQSQKVHRSPSPPPSAPPSRSQAFNPPISFPSSSTSKFPSKPSNLRGQKSHSGLKCPSPTATRKFARKASLSCLFEGSNTQESTSKPARYEEPTASSRARTHKNTASRVYDMKIPPTRPPTPSSNPAALRLTLPSLSRVKSRPALSSVFSPTSSGPRPTSPLHPRPPSSLSKPPIVKPTTPPVPKVLRRPKRFRTYGDGTELDGIADLPTDRDKETRYRVQPKGHGNRIPGATYSSVVKSSGGPVRAQGKEPVAEAGKSNTFFMTDPFNPLSRTLVNYTAAYDYSHWYIHATSSR